MSAGNFGKNRDPGGIISLARGHGAPTKTESDQGGNFMNSTISPLAVEIFAAVKSARPNAVFLCTGEEYTVLSFGPCCTSKFRYRISLDLGGAPLDLSSDDRTPLSIFLEQKKDGAVRLVIYAADAEPIEFDNSAGISEPLMGYIFIEAHEANGPGQAVIHAAFAGEGGTSLLIDSSPQLLHHLEIASKVWGVKKGEVDLVDIFQTARSLELEA